MVWKRLSGEPLVEPIFTKVESTIVHEKKLGNDLKVCIGTDSQVYNKVIEFASVIVFLRKGKGGYMYVAKEKMTQEMGLKERMILEVTRSVTIAYQLCTLFDKYNVELEVHADINSDPQFKSNIALKEAMGYILGMGFAFKSKPDAFASSSCADKCV